MPTTSPIDLEGPEGHAKGTHTEWDYDRAGGASIITCECGWRSQQYEGWREAKAEHDKHVQFVQRQADAAKLSNEELAEKLIERYRLSMSGKYGWGSEWLLEAAKRLGVDS